MIEILHRWTKAVLYKSETATTVKEAIGEANLSGADLSRANLSGADLSGADLSEADLSEANLSEANLSGANLSGANLREANLSRANLSEANLSGANLRGADLRRANLSEADLTPIRDDIRAVLAMAPKEVPGLLAKVNAGEVDGSLYEGECACLLGTIANLRECRYTALGDLRPDSNRPAERWFLGIAKGDTPEKSPVAKLTAEWIQEWLNEQVTT